MKTRTVLAAMLTMLSMSWPAPAVAAGAQTPAPADTVKADPLRCWWRTSVAAVRVGEPFDLVLTCAAIETETVTVVPSRTELEPDAMQLPPFDVIGGSRSDDLRTADERFFQYQYRLRLVSPDLFGRDVRLPELKITYRVRTRSNGDVLEGRDLAYILPEESVRVLSLVPTDATDIRDASPDTFNDIGRGTSRANLLRLIGGILIGFGVLAALLGIVRAFGATRKRSAVARSVVSDPAILRGIGRELSSLQQARAEGTWTPALTARLLTALRIISGYALEWPARPVAVDATVVTAATEGALTVRVPGLGGHDATIAGWVTPVAISEELAVRQKSLIHDSRRSEMLEELRTALVGLTRLQYGRDHVTGTAGDAADAADRAIDDALATGSTALGRLKADSTWLAQKLRPLRFRAARLEHKAWSR